MQQLDNGFIREWHVAINSFHFDEDGNDTGNEYKPWMYLAKAAAGEAPRLTRLFAQERQGQLPQIHQQCSHSESEPIKDNHLTCCLGTKCLECPQLLALDKAKLEPEQVDYAKAWTCASHILFESGNDEYAFDSSEGFILRVDDRMFWDGIYSNLAGAMEEE